MLDEEMDEIGPPAFKHRPQTWMIAQWPIPLPIPEEGEGKVCHTQ